MRGLRFALLTAIVTSGCGSGGGGTDLAGTPAPLTIDVLHAFDGTDGAWSRGSLTAVGTTLYGRTAIGGTANSGTVFRIGDDGTGFQSLYSFSAGGDNTTGNQPHHNAMIAVGSMLIGAALYGGNTMNAAAFRLSEKPPEPPVDKSGNGTVFTIGTDGSDYTVLLELDGGDQPALPHSPPMLGADGETLYGMTSNGGAHDHGTLYALSTAGGSATVLYSFKSSDGEEPHGVPVYDSKGTKLLGLTRKGGTPSDSHDTGAGVIFSYDLAHGAYTVLHTFVADSTSDGDTNAHGFLTLDGTVAYGTTEKGGKHLKGTLFSIGEDGSGFQIEHSFGAKGDGEKPFGSLVAVDGWLYGTTTEGGAHGDGTLFRFHLSDGKYELLASFDRATSGAFPEDNVTLSADGTTLIGLTQAGGVNDPDASHYYGTVFSIPVP
jgi:uncharacterized repeat protein (TIGR03803 family)